MFRQSALQQVFHIGSLKELSDYVMGSVGRQAEREVGADEDGVDRILDTSFKESLSQVDGVVELDQIITQATHPLRDYYIICGH